MRNARSLSLVSLIVNDKPDLTARRPAASTANKAASLGIESPRIAQTRRLLCRAFRLRSPRCNCKIPSVSSGVPREGGGGQRAAPPYPYEAASKSESRESRATRASRALNAPLAARRSPPCVTRVWKQWGYVYNPLSSTGAGGTERKKTGAAAYNGGIVLDGRHPLKRRYLRGSPALAYVRHAGFLPRERATRISITGEVR